MGISLQKLFQPNPDVISVSPENPLISKVKRVKEEMTGWERVKMIFVMDDLGEITPELHRCRDAAFMAFFIGGIMGAIGRSKIAYSEFFRSNYHEAFETPLKAKAALQQKVTMGMLSGGFRVGWRIGAFTGIYMLTSTCIAAYRNKMGILDQVGGGGVAGFIYKFKDGPKATFSGTLVGTCLGLVAGTATHGLVKLTGIELEQANLWYYENVEKRQKREREILNSSPTKDDGLTKFHDAMMSTLSSLDALPNPSDDVHEQSSSSSKTTDSSKPIISNKESNNTETNISEKLKEGHSVTQGTKIQAI